ncbi:SCO family protein [Granulicoccus sp. GXG6511]|uniref:SCO family protein n=1 Tax=Granulicoccus sp. GXG6511 TaxID=3381351 RepID=UPI003D7C972E
MRRCLIALALLGAVLVVGCMSPRSQGAVAPKAPEATPGYHGAWQDRPFVMPDLTLTDTSGQRFNLRKSPSSSVTLVFFGYRECPNVCGDVLTGLAGALERVPMDVHDDVTVLVIDITPDPAPAHQAQLRSWLDRFDRDFVGLTPPADEVPALAAELGVEIHRDPDGMLLHGDQIVAFDRDDNGVLVWTSEVPVNHVADDLALLVARQR